MKQLSIARIAKVVRWHRTGFAMLALFVALVAGLSAVASAVASGNSAETPEVTEGLCTVPETERKAGEMLVPLRVHDAGIALLLRVGDRLTVVTSTPEGEAVTIAEHVRVAQLPSQDDGVLSNSGSSGTLIVVAVPKSTAVQLAAVGDRWLGVIIE